MTASNAELALAWQLTAAGLPESVAEYRFHSSRQWRIDRCWPAHKVGVEIEGGTWSGGRHVRGVGFEEDCVKYAEAALLGWIVLRVTPRMVDDGRALRLIERAIELQET